MEIEEGAKARNEIEDLKIWIQVHTVSLSLHQNEQAVPVPNVTLNEDEKAKEEIKSLMSWLALCPPLYEQVEPEADTKPTEDMRFEWQVNIPAEAGPDADPYDDDPDDVDMENESTYRAFKKAKGLEPTGDTGQETAMPV